MDQTRKQSVRVVLLAGLLLTLVAAGCASDGPSSAEVEAAAAAGSSMVGKPSTDFTLQNQNREPVTLSQYRGKWVVLYFYPQDDTPGCTCQATDFSKLLAQFDGMNATVLGVSPQGPDRHQRFRQKFGLHITLLSDQDYRIAKAYGAWAPLAMSEGTMGRIVRTTYIIDPSGQIVWHWPEVLPVGHAERVRQRLEILQMK